MHIIITDAWLARTQAMHLNGWKLLAAACMASLMLMLGSVAAYHWVFLEGIRQGWPGFASVARLVQRDQSALQDAHLRANIDAMARRLGEMQARMLQIDSLGERVAGLAGLNPAEIRTTPGSGGLLVGPQPLDMNALGQALDELDRSATERVDWLTVIESRLFDQTIQRSMIPTEMPVKDVELGSRFGLRIDPFTGQQAMHTGVDFPAEVGTPIVAAAGGVVMVEEFHPAYGQMVEIDHGNNISTRYAHASKVLVKKGDLVKRGDLIAEVGSTGRSTGPHLHFEVLVSGVPQNPARFLAANPTVANQRAQSPPHRH